MYKVYIKHIPNNSIYCTKIHCIDHLYKICTLLRRNRKFLRGCKGTPTETYPQGQTPPRGGGADNPARFTGI